MPSFRWSRQYIIYGLLVGLGLLTYSLFWAAPLPHPRPLSGSLPLANPPQQMAVFQLPTGVNHRTAAFAYRGGSFFDQRDFAMIALLVKHPKGDLLIDTGFGRHVSDHFQSMPVLFRAITSFDPNQPAADQLQAVGYNLKSLRAVLLTHAHWDHVSGLPDFPHLPVWLTHEEHQFINQDSSTELIRSFPDINFEEYSFTSGPYLNFTQSHDVYGDGALVIVPAPGHTPGSVIVFINLPSGKRFALIGDLCWQQEGIFEREERPWLQRTLFDWDGAQVRANILRVAALVERFPAVTIVPAHDARGFNEIPVLLAKSKLKP